MTIGVAIGIFVGIPVGVWCCTGPRKSPHRQHRAWVRYLGRYFVARSLFDLVFRRR